ncbi:hypothetical protein [Neogemmobacter tilapiae]|uniref:Uncharacterized protein n=1 Tax=Neogemmobacter tilapiae TaxID=875041 RepID=A0A918TPJ8_9RHOB|nr:hypothetical protein [Gemmobacter tilapiae]GHC57611.1 hypothetical protein GCM10007315_21330 [Gemmobacter tilapiae]
MSDTVESPVIEAADAASVEPEDTTPRPQLTSFWAIFVGYLAACCVFGSFLGLYLSISSFVADPANSNPFALLTFSTLYLTFFASIFAWPGFIFLRSLLHVTGRKDPVSFAVAGLLNVAIMAVILFGSGDFWRFLEYPPDSIMLPIGFAAGGAAGLVEQYLTMEASVKVSDA